MATKEVKFTVTPSDGVKAYWIAVGKEDVTLVDGKGSIRLQTDRKHFLVWWFVGNSGSFLSIVGEASGKTVVEMKKSTIPPSEHEGARAKRFEM